MKKRLCHKRIPTVIAIVLVFASIWVTSFLIQTGVGIILVRKWSKEWNEKVSVSEDKIELLHLDLF